MSLPGRVRHRAQVRHLGEHPGKHHPHRYRHGVVTEFVKGKVNPTTVQKMLGHADLSTTARYLHLDDRFLADTVDDLYGDHDGLSDTDQAA